MACERSNEMQAYYDGELSPSSREALEAHLRQCAECREMLADLRGLSQMLLVAPLAEMRAGATQRLYGAWYKAGDRDVLRVASWLTAAAAAVLLGAILSWPGEQPPQMVRAPDVLETVAVMSPNEVHDDNRGDLVILAQWMADDLSVGERR